MREYLAILGFEVEDIVTGFKGTATTVGFDLYGCVQVVVKPRTDKDGKQIDSERFDFKRLKRTSAAPIMQQPTFVNVPGPEAKPRMSQNPLH